LQSAPATDDDDDIIMAIWRVSGIYQDGQNAAPS
jgi:hypothetical protein